MRLQKDCKRKREREMGRTALFFNEEENQDLFISMAVNTLYPYVYLSIYKLMVVYEQLISCS